MAELVLTEEEEREVHEGEAAGLLLESPSFLLAIEKVRADCAEGILTSKPEQGAERERLYNLSRGLSAVTEELLAMQARGQTIAANAALTNNQDDEDLQAEEPEVPVEY